MVCYQLPHTTLYKMRGNAVTQRFFHWATPPHYNWLDYNLMGAPHKAAGCHHRPSTKLPKNGFIRHPIRLAFQYSTPWQRYTNRLQSEDLLFQGAMGLQKSYLHLLTSYFTEPIAQKQQSYIKDTRDFINFLEKTKVPQNTVLVSMDVTSLNKMAVFKKRLCMDHNKKIVLTS